MELHMEVQQLFDMSPASSKLKALRQWETNTGSGKKQKFIKQVAGVFLHFPPHIHILFPTAGSPNFKPSTRPAGKVYKKLNHFP